jgi:metacaspase-1
MKRALCVGINDYPGTDMDLAGCVNDARDWQALLESRGYSVTPLYDAQATRAAVMEGLKVLLKGAAHGDSLVFTFSGHGSWLPDDDRDEPDRRDEMMCPYDVMKNEYLMDDDLHALFSTTPAGARLYVISDCCHSGSVVRGARPAAKHEAPLKARFLPPQLLARGNRSLEHALDRAARKPAEKKQQFPALLFSGCKDTEFSYDTSFGGRPNGAFTRAAIDALKETSVVTPKALYDAVRRKLPSASLPQTPQLFGSQAAQLGDLF